MIATLWKFLVFFFFSLKLKIKIYDAKEISAIKGGKIERKFIHLIFF